MHKRLTSINMKSRMKLDNSPFNSHMAEVMQRKFEHCTFYTDMSENGGLVLIDKINHETIDLINISNENWQNGGVELDGSTEYFDTGKTIAELGLDYNDEFTISLWFKFPSTNYEVNFGGAQDNTTAAAHRMILLKDGGSAVGSIRFDFLQTTSNYIRKDTPQVFGNSNEWQNLTVTYDGSGTYDGMKLYRNGVDIGGGGSGVGLINGSVSTANTFYLGAKNIGGNPDLFSNEIITNHFIANKVHSPELIAQIFEYEREFFNV